MTDVTDHFSLLEEAEEEKIYIRFLLRRLDRNRASRSVTPLSRAACRVSWRGSQSWRSEHPKIYQSRSSRRRRQGMAGSRSTRRDAAGVLCSPVTADPTEDIEAVGEATHADRQQHRGPPRRHPSSDARPRSDALQSGGSTCHGGTPCGAGCPSSQRQARRGSSRCHAAHREVVRLGLVDCGSAA